MNNIEQWLKKLSDSVFDMEDEEFVRALTQDYVSAGFPAIRGITEGLVDGMNRASAMYEEGEYFVSDILMCADAMYAGLDVLRPYLPDGTETESKIKAVIGVIEGDTHDIGKNLVKILLETAGFEMYDLGRDVSAESFVAKAKEVGAKLICISTLMTTTMPGMAKVINLLKEEGIRDNVTVMVGGGPLSETYAKKIGADCYSRNAVEAVVDAKRLLRV